MGNRSLQGEGQKTSGGGLGGSFSFCTHEERSKSKNAMAFSCAESAALLQPLGNGAVRFAGCTEQGLLKSGDQGFKV